MGGLYVRFNRELATEKEAWLERQPEAADNLGEKEKAALDERFDKESEILGATRQTVPASETYTLMQRGAVDAVSFPFSYAHAAYKINELSDWFTGNLQPGTSECPMVINKKAFQALPSQYQDLLMGLKGEVTQAMIDKYQAADAKNLPAFEAKMTKIMYSDEEIARFKDVAGKPIWDKWIKDNADKFDSQALFDRMMGLVDQAQAKYAN